MKPRSLLLVLALLMTLSGCVSFTTDSYQPDYEMIDNLKRLGMAKISLAEFEPRNQEAEVNKIGVRSATLISPYATYSNYIQRAIESDLKEMGAYDPKATTRIEATILKNDIDLSGITAGYGVLEARVKVLKNGSYVLDQVYNANTQFDSSFFGDYAVTIAKTQYPLLVRKFLRNLYSDPAFIKAVKK